MDKRVSSSQKDVRVLSSFTSHRHANLARDGMHIATTILGAVPKILPCTFFNGAQAGTGCLFRYFVSNKIVFMYMYKSTISSDRTKLSMCAHGTAASDLDFIKVYTNKSEVSLSLSLSIYIYIYINDPN